MKDIIIKKSSSAALYTLVFKTMAQMSGIGLTILLIRMLSEHDYGIYNIFYSTIGVFIIIGSFGLGNVLLRYIPEYYARGEMRLAHRLYRVSSLLRFGSNLILLGVFLFFWEPLSAYLHIQGYRTHFLFFSLIIFIYMQHGLLNICLGAYFLQKYSQGMLFVFSLIRLAGYVLVTLRGGNLIYVFSVEIFAYIILFTASQIIYSHKIPKTGGSHEAFPPDEKRRLIRYGTFYNFNDMGDHLLDVRADNYVIAAFLDPVSVAAYSFCNRIAALINRGLPVNYLLEVIRPLFFNLGMQKKEGVGRYYQFLVKNIYMAYFPAFFFVFAFRSEIINVLFGGKYQEYGTVLILVMGFQLLSGFQIPLGLVAQLRERAGITMISKAFGVMNLLLDVIFIQLWGITGVAIATGASVLGKNFFILWFVKKEANFKGMLPFFLMGLFFWAAVAVIGRYVLPSFENPAVNLLLGTLTFIAAAPAYIRMWVFNGDEKRLLVKFMPNQRYLSKYLGVA